MRQDEERREKARRILLVAMLVVAVAVVYLVFNVSAFEELTSINAIDYAQVARHVVEGEGLTTSFIKPLGLVFNHKVERHPEMSFPPLHILWTAGVMNALGVTDRAVSHSSGLAFILTIPLVFYLGFRLFDWRTATLATAVWGTHLLNLQYAVSGLEASLLTLLLTGLLVALHVAATSERHELWWVAGAGALVGLLYLTKYIWVAAAIPVIIYLWLMRDTRRAARVLVFLLLLIVIISPWLYRNYRILGHPFFTLRTYEMMGDTRAYPANAIYRHFGGYMPGYFVFAHDNPRAVFEKVRGGLTQLYGSFHGIAGLFVTPFFLVAVLVRLAGERFERLRHVVYAMLLLVALMLAFVMAARRLISPLGPFVTVVAIAFFWRLLEAGVQHLDERRQARYTTLAVAVLLLLHLHPLMTTLTPDTPPWEAAASGESVAELAMAELTQYVDEPILTDSPWLVAWHTHEDAVWIPQTQQDLRRMEDAVGRFRWLLLTPNVGLMAERERLEQWAEVWADARRGRESSGFIPVARLGNGQFMLLQRAPQADEQ